MLKCSIGLLGLNQTVWTGKDRCRLSQVGTVIGEMGFLLMLLISAKQYGFIKEHFGKTL